MKKVIVPVIILLICSTAFSQTDVTLASTALENGNYEEAWNTAHAALKNSSQLSQEELYQAYIVKAKAGANLVYNIMAKGTEDEIKKNLFKPAKVYEDFQQVWNTERRIYFEQIEPEYFKLGYAMLIAGSEYNNRFVEKSSDSSLLDKAIENYTGTITVWRLGNKERYRPYHYRGDAYLEKKEYEKAIADFKKGMEVFEAAERSTPDLGVGDLGYRLAYTQAGVFQNNTEALQTIARTRKLLEKEMAMAEEMKDDKEKYDILKEEYDLFLTEFNTLEESIKSSSR